MSVLATSERTGGTMSAALVIGARNLGFSVIERLIGDGWDVAGGAVSAETLERVGSAGACALEVDVTDQASVLAALEQTGKRFGRVDLVVNAASPYAGPFVAPFGGGPLAESEPEAFDRWATMPARGAYAFLSASARYLKEQGGQATVVQITGGSSKRGRCPAVGSGRPAPSASAHSRKRPHWSFARRKFTSRSWS
jgi:NAD(P)-dependent dehydrogenase (short-subunit alcohol dehydrogenase family)